MRYILMDYLQCPSCLAFPLQLYVFESNVNATGSTSLPIKKRRCTLYCAFNNKTFNDSTSELLQCSECLKTEINTGLLYCNGCARWYPIQRGIPSIMRDELRYEDEDFFKKWFTKLPEIVQKNALTHSSKQVESNKIADRTLKDKLREIKLRDDEAELYDSLYPDDKCKAELDTYNQLFQPEPGALVLDVGCGTGRVTKNFLQKNVFLIGVDFSQQSLLYFRKRLGEEQLPNVHLVRGDICHLPFRANVFHYVISLGLFYHLPGEEMRNKGLENTIRVLKQEGVFIGTTYNYSLLKRISGFLGLSKEGHKEGHKEGGVYYYNHSSGELIDWLAPHFNITDLIGIDNRFPIVQHFSAKLNAKFDHMITHTPLALPIFSREIAVKGIKK